MDVKPFLDQNVKREREKKKESRNHSAWINSAAVGGGGKGPLIWAAVVSVERTGS